MTILGFELSPTMGAIVSTLLIMVEAIGLYVIYSALMRRLSARFDAIKRSGEGS